MVYDNKSVLAVLYVMVTIDMNIGLCKDCLKIGILQCTALYIVFCIKPARLFEVIVRVILNTKYYISICLIISCYIVTSQWSRCCATNREVAGLIPVSVSGFFIDIKSFRSHCGPGVDSASNRNEYQEHFLGVKLAGA